MVPISLNLLVIVCISLLIWGVSRLDRIYQYPFFMGAIFISFLLPQGFALVSDLGVASVEIVDRVLLVSTACAAMCWIGYAFKPKSDWLKKLNVQVHEVKLRNAGIALMVTGSFL
jgi:hypothetical protein